MLHGEVRNGNWGVITDLFFAKLGSDIMTPRDGIIDVKIKALEFEAFLARRVLNSERGFVDVYAGARIWDFDFDLDVDIPPLQGEIMRGDSWVDPVVGARAVHYIAPKWPLLIRGDIGGFGTGSDFSWQIIAGAARHFNDWFSMSLQYRALSADFDNGKDGTPEFFAYDAVIHGPQLGFIFNF